MTEPLSSNPSFSLDTWNQMSDAARMDYCIRLFTLVERLTRERDEAISAMQWYGDWKKLTDERDRLAKERDEALNCIRGGTYIQKEWIPNIFARLEAERDRLRAENFNLRQALKEPGGKPVEALAGAADSASARRLCDKHPSEWIQLMCPACARGELPYNLPQEKEDD